MGRDLFWVQVSRLSFEYVGAGNGTFFSLFRSFAALKQMARECVGAGFTIIVCCHPNVTKPALTEFCINWNME